jgi:soluble lytic murein transglycosylase
MKAIIFKRCGFLLFCLFVLVNVTSCMNVSSCSLPQQVVQDVYENEFFLGLLADSSPEYHYVKVGHFERSLTSPNVYIRRAAAGELAVLMTQGVSLSGETMQSMQREASGAWAAAFEIIPPLLQESVQASVGLESIRYPINREKALSFLLNFEPNAVFYDEARLYVLNECRRQQGLFTNLEIAAIEGHFSVLKLRYADGVRFFRAFQQGGNWPAQIPQLFLEYPSLINDLGRAFQFTQAANSEGLTLFQNWETSLSRSANASDDIRYRLLFFSGRIARRMGQNPLAVTLFDRALNLAPDYEQQDACIWYILDVSMTGPINVIMERLERYVPRWHNVGSYNGIMERYLHRLVSAKDWGRVVRTYNLIKDTNAFVPKSGFAYVIARAIEEGFLSAEERRQAARAINAPSADSTAYMRIAYEQRFTLLMPAIFYRMKSADVLGLPFLEMAEYPGSAEPSQVLEFLLGFFKNDAVAFLNPYLRSFESRLTPDELRAVAHAYGEVGMHNVAVRLVSLYIHRADYTRNRRDMEIMYPRPFLELIEKNSQHFNISPPLFFGLVRTESLFQHAVVSHAGAVGLSQLMPRTAREQAERIRRAGGPDFFCSEGNIDSTNPDLNIYIGSFYLNDRRVILGDMYLALMAYNAGQARVRRWRNESDLPMDLFLETVPIFETRDYGKRVTAVGRIYQELYY